MTLPKILILFCLLLNLASSNDPGSLKGLDSPLMSGVIPQVDIETSSIKQPGIDQNFEDKSIKPWMDCSEDGTNWVIENVSLLSNKPSQIRISPPPTESGTHYLWLKQDLETFGIGILNSPIFLAYPGDQIQFSFWIHSSFKFFNNLQVFWSPIDRKEEQKLIELFPASTNAENAKWRHSIARIPAYKPTEGEVIIYGFCEPKDGTGIIAIDNISLIRSSQFSRPTIADTTVFSHSDQTTEDTEVSDSFVSSTSSSTKEMTSSALMTTGVSFSTLPPISEGSCSFDTACDCWKTNFNVYDVNCALIPTNQIREEVFQKLEYYSSELGEFILKPPNNDSIPFDMFASSITYVNWFHMDCSNIENQFDVDPFAFSPLTVIANMYFHHCNFANLTFLSQPLTINDLLFENVTNFKNVWNTFPVDCKVKILRITKSNLLDLTQNDFPPHSTGLTELRVYENEKINDTIVDMISSWALQFSKDSLANFYVFNNGLKKIPTGLSRFGRLTFFRIDNNIFEPGIVRKGELRFSDYTRVVYLRFCGIHTIETGAFGGIYEMANVYLDGNNLTRFESNVYQDILSQMALLGDLEDGGFVNVEGNPFDCVDDPCHLTWLLRDNRKFLTFVWYAACANGTLFEDIQPDDPMFIDCP